jgi:putative phage-type endonuclease
MAISAQQKADRRNYIGSSDAAAILGLCPFRTPRQVYNSKVHAEDGHENEAMRAGSYLEDAVLNWFSDKLGLVFDRGVMKTRGIFAANFDGIHAPVGDDTYEPFVVEAKTHNVVGDRSPDSFGRSGSTYSTENACLPDRVVLQVQHQLYVAGPEYQEGYVAVLRGGQGFGWYRLKRDDALIDAMTKRLAGWWDSYVLCGTPPPPTDLDIERAAKKAAKLEQQPVTEGV